MSVALDKLRFPARPILESDAPPIGPSTGLALELVAGARPIIGGVPNVPKVGDPSAPPQLRLLNAAIEPLPSIARPERLREAFEALAPKATRADLRLLPKNRDAWLGAWHILETAKDGVDASYFILERDIFGMSFLGSLLHKSMQGQPVRLLVDSAGDYLRMSGFTLPARGGDYLQELVAHGAKVRIYNPMHKKALRWLLGKVRGFGTLANNHDKLVRSRTMAQTGGRNIAKDYLSEKGDLDEPTYRDTCVLLRGEETSRQLEKAFLREFSRDEVTFEQFADLFGNWRKRDGELLGAYLMMDAWVNGRIGIDARTLADPGARQVVADRIVEHVLAHFPEVGFTRRPSWLTMRSIRKRALELAGHKELYGAYPAFAAAPFPHENVEVKVLDRTSAALRGKDHLTHAIHTAARSAERKIRIHNPYVTLTEEAITALEVAGRRGVAIELLTNSPASTDSVLTQAFFLEDWPRLLARIPNLRIFVLAGDRKLHSKSIEVDDRLTFVKSYNLDILSSRVNSELGIVAWSESFAKEAGSAFDADLADPSHHVREYTIQRDRTGRPVLDDAGEPIVTFGAKHHIGAEKWRSYRKWRWLIRQLRKLDLLSEFQKPALAPKVSRQSPGSRSPIRRSGSGTSSSSSTCSS
jgi:phosphatidylserine/phosphatidylglycerophosphate/cardiolipin synthase-like enzyme